MSCKRESLSGIMDELLESQTPSAKKLKCSSPVLNGSEEPSLSGRALLSIEAGDYECSICLSLLVDPVVGEFKNQIHFLKNMYGMVFLQGLRNNK
jgi:hypothetical protein